MVGTSRGVAGGILTTLLLLLLAVLLQHHPLAEAAGEAAGEDVQYRRHRRIRRRDAPPRTPTTPPVQPSRPVHPAPPPPPPPTPSCNDTFAPEEGLTASGDVCSAPAPASAPRLPPPQAGRCPPCVCPTPPKPQPLPQPPRPFPGWPVPRTVPVPGRGGSNAGAGISSNYCVMVLARMSMACSQFIEAGNETESEAPTPATECCSGLADFIRASSAAAATGRGDVMLQCLCPYVLGDVNKTMQKPIDPVKMMSLPVACGVVLPPQLLFVCFTGRPLPEVDDLSP